MSTRLVIDQSNQLKELKRSLSTVRLLAKLISIVFHPLFVPIYIILFLLYVHPSVFVGFPTEKKLLVFFQSILPYVALPLITVLLLKALNFIDTILLTTQKDRIIPYIACNLWYFWIAYVWYNQPDYPREIIVLSITIFIASVIGQLANIYMKISMHAIAMGVLLSFILFLAMIDPSGAGLYISVAIIITGLVCSARFIASDHRPKEIYGGLLAGPIALAIAVAFAYHA